VEYHTQECRGGRNPDAGQRIRVACIACISGRLRDVNRRIDRYHAGILSLMASAARSGGSRSGGMAECRIQERCASPGGSATGITGGVAGNAIRSGCGYVTGIHRLGQKSRPVMARITSWRGGGGCREGCIGFAGSYMAKDHARKIDTAWTSRGIGGNRSVATAGIAIGSRRYMSGNFSGGGCSIVAGAA